MFNTLTTPRIDTKKVSRQPGILWGLWRLVTGPALWLFIGFTSIYFLTGAFTFFSTDGEVMYQTAREIGLRFRVDQPPTPGLSQIFQGPDGLYYSKYGLGQPLLAAGLFNFGRWVQTTYMAEKAAEPIAHFFVCLLPLLACSLTVWLVYLWAKQLYNSKQIAIVLAVVAGIGTSLWPYSHFFFSEPLYMFCIFGAAFATWRACKARLLGGRYFWLLVGGLGMGYAVMTRVAGIVLLPAFALYLWVAQFEAGEWWNWRKQGRWQRLFKDGLAFGLGFLPFVLIILYYNRLRSGNPFDNAYSGEGFTTPIWEGIWGLLFSTGKSIFLYAPVLIAVPFAARYFWRRFAPETLFFGVLMAITLIYNGAWWSWYGGFSWGPRFLVPLMPFAVLMLGVLLLRSRQWVTVILVILLPVSVFVQMAGVAVDFNPHLGKVTQYQPGWDANYNWIPALSPLRAHLSLMWQPELNVIRGLTLEQLGLEQNSANFLTMSAWTGFVLALFIITVNAFKNLKSKVS